MSLYLLPRTPTGAPITGTPQVALDGRSWASMTVIGGRSGGWVRYGVQVRRAGLRIDRLDIRLSSGQVFRRCRAGRGQRLRADLHRRQPGRRLSLGGLVHGSASTRSAQVRAGGRERNLLDDYAIEVVEGTKRIGTPPLTHHLVNAALLPGAIHQGTKILPREIELYLHYTVGDAGSDAATWRRSAPNARRCSICSSRTPSRAVSR